tara:strand:+ start:253 stop:597 length:345 start_codon:yes stop_codon:yes gene_type:complete
LTSKLVFLNFFTSEGKCLTVEATPGMTLLEVAWKNCLKVEGACGGSMACSTCHLIIDSNWVEKLPRASDEESQMLDLTWGRKKNSRLGCQIKVTNQLNGLIVSLPIENTNLLGN